METRYTIGDFARIARLSPKSLRRYDELGLLRPAHVDPWTGYRFYTLAQAPRARAIALLRAVDMPLASIRELLAGDAEEVRMVLGRHRELLAQRLTDYQHMLLQVERLIQRGEVVGLEMKVKELPATTLWVERATCPTESEQIGAFCGQAYQRLYAAMAQAGAAPAGPPWLRYLDMDGEEWTIEAGIPVSPESAPVAGVERVDVPATTVVAALHRGPYNELGMSYQELGDWAAGRGYQSAGPMIDIYLNDPAKADPVDLETEICVPVTVPAG